MGCYFSQQNMKKVLLHMEEKHRLNFGSAIKAEDQEGVSLQLKCQKRLQHCEVRLNLHEDFRRVTAEQLQSMVRQAKENDETAMRVADRDQAGQDRYQQRQEKEEAKNKEKLHQTYPRMNPNLFPKRK